MYLGSPGFQPQGNVLPLEYVVHPSGSWERYDAYDADGRPTVVVSQFLNAPTNAVESECRAVYYDYTPITAAGDDGSLEPRTPRQVEECLLGNLIARKYAIIKPGEKRFIRCSRPSAAWNDSENLVTTNKYYQSGSFAGRLKCVGNPDRTRQAYIYTSSGSGTNATETTVLLSGEIDTANETNILSGTITTTVIGHVGQVSDPGSIHTVVHST
jgi:hypothetical protein